VQPDKLLVFVHINYYVIHGHIINTIVPFLPQI
jgi:hypothetical protein